MALLFCLFTTILTFNCASANLNDIMHIYNTTLDLVNRFTDFTKSVFKPIVESNVTKTLKTLSSLANVRHFLNIINEENLETKFPKLQVTINVIQTNETQQKSTSTYVTITPDIKSISVEISSGISFFIIQAHSIKNAISLYNNEMRLDPRTDIGLVQHINGSIANYVFYLESDNATSAILHIQGYNDNAPIPGGCNLVNEPEEIPYQSVVISEDMISTVVEPASQKGKTCEESNATLEMYIYFSNVYYGSDCDYYKEMGKFLTVKGIRKYGRKVSETKTNTRLVYFYNNYYGRGQIYAVIANSGNSSSAYVASTTFGDEETTSYQYKLGTFFFICGVIASTGGRTFILFANIATMMWFIVYLVGVGTGLVLWYKLAVPAVPITVYLVITCNDIKGHRLVSPVIMGYLVMNMIFYFSGLPDTVCFRSNVYYLVLRVSILIIVSLIFASCEGLLNVLSSLFYISNGLSMLSSGVLHYHLWFDFRRITNSNFALANIVIPTETVDVIAIAVATILCVLPLSLKVFSNRFGYIGGMVRAVSEGTPLLSAY